MNDFLLLILHHDLLNLENTNNFFTFTLRYIWPKKKKEKKFKHFLNDYTLMCILRWALVLFLYHLAKTVKQVYC